jgi:hypothetical protein
MPTIGETSRPGFVYDSATDTWIPVGIGPHSHTPAAIGAISSSVVTTKGDIIAATGSGTVVRQGVGPDGSVLMADSSQADGLNWASTMQYAGKNKMINGDFGVWQRGTSISVTAGSNIFTADRYQAYVNGGTATASQQTFTPGAAPVAGYEGTYFHRLANAAGGTYWELQQKIEDVRTFAGQTVTFSFWAKASSAHLARTYINQYFGVSGSANNGSGSADVALTTSWQRYTLTVTLGSMAGKTIGAGSYINIFLFHVSGAIGSVSIDTWGWQLEPGSVATPFQTASGSIAGELALCQRYFESTDYALVTTPNLYAVGYWKVPKRVSPTITVVTYSVGSGGNVGATAYNPASSFWLTVYNSVSGQCAISGSAEL